MRLCNDGHDEVCYEGYNCPACNVLRDKEHLQEEVQDLKSEIDELKAEIAVLENQLDTD